MPNWCSNIVTIAHEDHAMIKRAVKAARLDALFNEFVPCPEALSKTTEGSFNDPVEQAELEALREHNQKTYGYSSWYDFAIGEWGTKWDISNSDSDYNIEKVDKSYTVTLFFDTAWSPPIKFYEKLEKLEFTVEAMYYEPGVNFCGQYFEGQDEHYELNGSTSEQVKEQVPEELDQAFGISDELEQYEEDQEDV